MSVYVCVYVYRMYCIIYWSTNSEISNLKLGQMNDAIWNVLINDRVRATVELRVQFECACHLLGYSGSMRGSFGCSSNFFHTTLHISRTRAFSPSSNENGVLCDRSFSSCSRTSSICKARITASGRPDDKSFSAVVLDDVVATGAVRFAALAGTEVFAPVSSSN